MRKGIKSGLEIYLVRGVSKYGCFARIAAKNWKHILNKILESPESQSYDGQVSHIKYSEVRIREFNNAIKIDAFIDESNVANLNTRSGFFGKEKNRVKRSWTIFIGIKEVHYTQNWAPFPYKYSQWL